MKKQLSYIDSVHRSGTIWNISVMILLLAFPLTVAALFWRRPGLGRAGGGSDCHRAHVLGGGCH